MSTSAADLYLDLPKKVLTRVRFEEEVRPVRPEGRMRGLAFEPLRRLATKRVSH